jgi:hypothetical protein
VTDSERRWDRLGIVVGLLLLTAAAPAPAHIVEDMSRCLWLKDGECGNQRRSVHALPAAERTDP